MRVMVIVKGVELEEADIENVLKDIDAHGIPSRRRSKGFCLRKRGNHYPPKLVLLRAWSAKSGKKDSGFRGGKRTNKPLQDLHYTVVPCQCGGKGITVVP